ncbi:ImmA/IrrE family metallo-endopeptidase [Aeoliella mucimassa]|uniref:IrrE N-terminal-like domain-containing protein n=1 Tax=Aeoliella mucimassa TaxID=2527972 RepID=A0A518AS47_9BACT|nr:ImmA/IrrE family metallo-endopeptidase [Aeoliella mucimassa]QDU57528.1 hypothetical protein Pan181_37460 [Aeoliella mucimassa]
MTKTTWNLINSRLGHAERKGEEVAEVAHQNGLPIDPFAIARSEHPLLKFTLGDFHDAFDGQLEYHRKHNRFLIFLNTKYDIGQFPGEHHPRTRFSMGHELAHYYLEPHRAYLIGGGNSHGSESEFKSDELVEREADAFAAGLLMPNWLFSPRVNKTEPSFDLIQQVASEFQTSMLSTAIRTVQLSHFPCGLACVRQSSLAWMFCSTPLIEAGCYPGERGSNLPETALLAWKEHENGNLSNRTKDGVVGDWFRTYDATSLESTYVCEHYFSIPVMNSLLVLLTVDEDDLADEEE